MIKPNIINFDYPFKELPVIEVNLNSTASGDITINDDNIEENNDLAATLYKVTPPSSTTTNWVRTGDDLFTPEILALSTRKKSTGLIVIEYSLDPAEIAGVADGDFYGATIKLNAAAGASTAQAGVELIFKINDMISGE